ncbi:Conserved_hypothetical protein [Hexamita inflata]|uniref:Uncharacterized protein n=1 Tax=Hexamita inflata TaxID=28002 RepID=A0AA86R8D1_9EUKA|nr:Conserved hypothetical protein [Hexamita inflata]
MFILFSSILCKSVKASPNSLCDQQLTVGDRQFAYCQKAKALLASTVSQQMQISSSSSNVFIFTEKIHGTQISLEMSEVSVFAVFGFTSAPQRIYNSTVNVSLRFRVVQAALVCLQCDLSVHLSTFVFQAEGQVLSGAVLVQKTSLLVENSSVQFRFRSKQSAGLVNSIFDAFSFAVRDSRVTGYNGIPSDLNGYFASQVNFSTAIATDSVFVCATGTPVAGKDHLLQPSTETARCMGICDSAVVYGFCSDGLVLGKYEAANTSYYCEAPFEFGGEGCSCPEGHVVQASRCVSVVGAVNDLEKWLRGNVTVLSDQSGQNAAIELKLQEMDRRIAGNTTNILAELDASHDLSESHLARNSTALSSKLDSALADINSQMVSNNAFLLQTLLENTSALDKSISDNATALYLRIAELTQNLTDGVSRIYANITAVNASVLEIDNALAGNMTRFSGNISDIDQHLLSNATAVNSTLLDLKTQVQADVSLLNASVLDLTGNLTANVSAVNVSILAINGSMSANLQLVNTSLDQINKNLESNITAVNGTIAAMNTSLVTNISLVNNTMNNRTSNISCNLSSINQTLISQVIASNIKIDRMMQLLADIQNQVIDVNQAELDPQFDFSDDFNIDLVCVQQVFTQSFDITTITSSVQSSNFTAAFVFDTQLVNNSFIDVSDSALPATYFYLFKTQSYFYNLKVQFGAQTLSSGSLIADNGVKMVNKVSIISKAGSALSVSSSSTLSILCKTCQTTNIRNLFINLAFASASTGSFTLINTVTSILNIRNYQVSGTYYSTQQSCLGALLVNNASVSISSLNFNPTFITFGNVSSYLFSQVNCSSLQLQKIVIQVGVSDVNPNIITIISTTSSTDLAFGGIVATVNQSNIDFKILTFQVFFSYNTMFINNSGQIVGHLNKSCIVSVQQICFQESVKLQTSAIVIMGLIGYAEGVISISRSLIHFSVTGDAVIQGLGTIALASPLCVKQLFLDLTLVVKLGAKSSINDEQNVSALVGRQLSLNWTVSNTIFRNLLLQRGKQIGAISGYCENSRGSLTNIQIFTSNISSSSYNTIYVGGLFGMCNNPFLTLTRIQIYQLSSASFGTVSRAGSVLGYVINGQIEIKQLEIDNANVSAEGTTLFAQAGMIGFEAVAQVTMSQVNIKEQNVTAISGDQTHGACVIGQANASVFVLISDLQVSDSQVYTKTTGNAISAASGTIGTLLQCDSYAQITLTVQKLQLLNIQIQCTSTRVSYSAGVIGVQNQSTSAINQVSLIQISMAAQGYNNVYQSGIIGSINNDDSSIQDYSAFGLKLTASSTNDNVTTGGAIGCANYSIIILNNCKLEQVIFSATGNDYALVGGYFGSLGQSTANQSQSSIFNSTISGSSANTETNSAGYFALAELSTRMYFEDCSVESIYVTSWSVTCRSILFGGRVEGAYVDVTKIRISNSQAITPLSRQPRAGSLFGRVYYSVINAVLVTIENVNLSARGTDCESEVAGVTTSLRDTSIAFRDSTIKNINISSYAKNESAKGSAIHSTSESSSLYIVNVVVENVNMTITQDNSSYPIYAAIIANSLFKAVGYSSYGSLQMTHVVVNSITIQTLPITLDYANLVIGYQQYQQTYIQAVDCYSLGTSKIQSWVPLPCSWKVQEPSTGLTYMRWNGCA